MSLWLVRLIVAVSWLGASRVQPGAAAFTSIEEDTFRAAAADGTAGSKPKTDIDPASMPKGKICDVSISRLLIGGNLIGGWAHSRDLMLRLPVIQGIQYGGQDFRDSRPLPGRAASTRSRWIPSAGTRSLNFNKSRSTPIQTMACIPFMEDKTAMNDTIKQQIDKGAHAALFARRRDRFAHDEGRQHGRDRPDGRAESRRRVFRPAWAGTRSICR